MTKIKRIAASCMTALCIAGSLSFGASGAAEPTSDTWSALGRNVPGAPTSVNSEPDYPVVYHQDAGATASMYGINHTVAGASSTTTIQCVNYGMDAVYIQDYSAQSRLLKPSVGTTRKDVRVEYKVYVSTNDVNDTVTSTGIISKIG